MFYLGTDQTSLISVRLRCLVLLDQIQRINRIVLVKIFIKVANNYELGNYCK